MRDKKKATLCTMKYKKKVYKRIPFEVKKEYYSAILEPAASSVNESVNGYIKKALDMRIGLSDEEIEARIQEYRAAHPVESESDEENPISG